jgi:hypothetical protein
MTFASQAKRTSNLLAAIGFAFAILLSVVMLTQGQAFAYNVAANRSIQLSSSVISVTNTSYLVDFDAGTTGAVNGIAVDFCTSPIIGTTCTKPAGLDVTATPAVTAVTVTGMSGGTWAATSDNNASGYRTFILDNATATGTVTAGGAITFTITTMTNPSTTNQTFYARIFTFAATGNAQTWADASSGDGSSVTGVVDAGGVALSTAAQLVITAKVQETLTFCIYTGAACVNAGTAINLGDGNGVLSNTAIDYEASGKFDLGTNAQGGAVVYVKGGLPTAGGGFTLQSIGATCTADSTTPADEDFGLRVVETAPVVADTAYDCAANSHSFDTTPAATTYGDVIANTNSDPLDTVTSTIEYSAKAGTSTEAGIYTANHTFIATATY